MDDLDGKWRSGCKALGALLKIRYEDCQEKFGSRWPYRLAPWIFACYNHLDDCKIFATKLPPEMPWRARLLAVGKFLNRLEGKLTMPAHGPFHEEAL